jgi:SAM-dependent methyltransferase
MTMTPPLNSRHGWQGWWPGWRAVLDPENGRIVAFLKEEAAQLPRGTRVLDAGAGLCPYAGIFHAQHYESCDMPGGFYRQKQTFECFLHEIPQPDNTYEAVILTQVLEHVPDPEKTLREIARILKPGGRLILSVPLNGPLHGEPYHFFQFTHHGLFELARRAGLSVVRCEKIGGAFWNLGKRTPDTLVKLLKQYDPGRARKRNQPLWLALLMTVLLFPFWLVGVVLFGGIVRPLCYWLDRLDVRKDFTLGYTLVLAKPAAASVVNAS